MVLWEMLKVGLILLITIETILIFQNLFIHDAVCIDMYIKALWEQVYLF